MLQNLLKCAIKSQLYSVSGIFIPPWNHEKTKNSPFDATNI